MDGSSLSLFFRFYSRRLPLKKCQKHHQAPEMYTSEHYTEKIDVFSYAINLWEIATEKIPYENINPTLAAKACAKEGKRLEIEPNSIPIEFERLIRSCWHTDPEKRPCMEDVIETLKRMDITTTRTRTMKETLDASERKVDAIISRME